MIIETKFKIDQKVFYVNGKEKCLYGGFIDEISINIKKTPNGPVKQIRYWIGPEGFDEDELFASEDDACYSLKNTIKWFNS